MFVENRQQTSKTENIYNKEGGEYIKKITQRTDTKVSNFSEFPNPVQEKQVKLDQVKEAGILKFRSRTVKRKFKGENKLRKALQDKNRNLKYYNIVTNLQKQPLKLNADKLCCDF